MKVKVQHYRMQMEDRFRRAVSPGQAVFLDHLDHDEVRGFIWKHDPIDNIVDVVLFEPNELELLPNQTFVAAEFPHAEIVFADTLEDSLQCVKEWWRRALTVKNPKSA